MRSNVLFNLNVICDQSSIDDVDTAGGWEVRVCRLVLDRDCCGGQQNISRTKSALTVVIAASCMISSAPTL